MPNPQNTVQVAAHRPGEKYLGTYELEADAIAPALRQLIGEQEVGGLNPAPQKQLEPIQLQNSFAKI